MSILSNFKGSIKKILGVDKKTKALKDLGNAFVELAEQKKTNGSYLKKSDKLDKFNAVLDKAISVVGEGETVKVEQKPIVSGLISRKSIKILTKPPYSGAKGKATNGYNDFRGIILFFQKYREIKILPFPEEEFEAVIDEYNGVNKVIIEPVEDIKKCVLIKVKTQLEELGKIKESLEVAYTGIGEKGAIESEIDKVYEKAKEVIESISSAKRMVNGSEDQLAEHARKINDKFKELKTTITTAAEKIQSESQKALEACQGSKKTNNTLLKQLNSVRGVKEDETRFKEEMDHLVGTLRLKSPDHNATERNFLSSKRKIAEQITKAKNDAEQTRGEAE
jgi:hypothetical protein